VAQLSNTDWRVCATRAKLSVLFGVLITIIHARGDACVAPTSKGANFRFTFPRNLVEVSTPPIKGGESLNLPILASSTDGKRP